MMSLRFMTNLLLLCAGAFVVVCSQAFGAGVTGWITFGVALGLLGMLGLAQFGRGRGITQHGLDVLTGALAIWTVIASVVFGGATVIWLSFAEGIGFAALAAAGLMLHELSTERIVHTLEVEETSRRSHYAEAV